MPHITIEHSPIENNEISLKELASELHYGLAKHDTIALQAIKTRTVEVSNVIIGDEGMQNKFLHTTIQLLTGRSEELKQIIIEDIFKLVKSQSNDDYSISVEIRELQTYKK